MSVLMMEKNIHQSTSMPRAWVEIDYSNLEHNLLQLHNILHKDTKVMAVVKADAYGHGMNKIALTLQNSGIDNFAVATLDEGILLRKCGISGSILILGYTDPVEVYALIKFDLIQTVVDLDYGQILNEYGESLKVHIKIDTGMNRLGETHYHFEFIEQIFELQNLNILGIYTHLCVSDSLKPDDIKFTENQINHFYDVIYKLKSIGYPIPKHHIQSSYGVLNYPQLKCDFARVGIALYGILSSNNDKTNIKADLRPVLSLKAKIALVKDIGIAESVGYGRQFISKTPMKIAVVTIGYADGIPRNLENGYVLLKGKKAPIIGRICMDQMTIDVTHIQEVKSGDIATIIGQDGMERITAEQVAENASTITNEILSRMGRRLEKIYL
ncbi:MAG: serine racemase VanT catalytic subunit [Eubacteriales bacterium]